MEGNVEMKQATIIVECSKYVCHVRICSFSLSLFVYLVLSAYLLFS